MAGDSNQSPFMNKILSKAIMLRTNLINKFLKNRSNENKTNYVKQRNHCVSLLRKTKREYYSNLDKKKICNSKTFWKIVKPMLSTKIKSNEKVTLIENDEIIKTEKGTSEVLNAFSSNAYEVIRTVFNFFFFLQKDFTRTKSTKSTKNT